MNNKNIVIINQDSGYLMIDLANAYVNAGYKVSLIAGRIVERDTALNGNVKWIKIIQYNKTTLIKRLLTWVTAFVQIAGLVLVRFRKHNLLIVSNPPLAPLLALVAPKRTSLLVYDIYPEILVEYGYLKQRSFVVQLWQSLNRKSFKSANRIITLTSGMASVLQKYTGEKEVEVIPVWTDNKFLQPLAKEDNQFVKTLKLEKKFVVMYSGNIGISNSVEILVEAANRMKSFVNIQFLIIGDGSRKKEIEKKINSGKTGNILLLDRVDAKDLRFSLASADLSVVILGTGASQLAIPSKLYNYLSVGSAILTIAEKNSDISRLTEDNGIGKSFTVQQVDEIVTFIKELFENTNMQKTFSSNALKLSSNYSKENIVKFIK